MTPDDDQSGRGELIGALILSVACLALVLWILAMSWGGHALFTSTSADPPEAGAHPTGQTRAAPGRR